MTKTTEENLSQSKYAEHRNVTKGYIARLIKEGVKAKKFIIKKNFETSNSPP